MKIVHAADLHLDSPLRGLTEYEGAPTAQIRAATRHALSALVSLCIEEGVALLLIAGDLYDGDFRDYSTALFFIEQMSRLREAGTRVVWLRGNHDAANLITKHLRSKDHVSELSSDFPESLNFEDLGITVHGRGYWTREVRENLVRSYPEPQADHLNIGLLHTSLDGREGHANYAPCSLSDLKSKGYDYWALGHVHQREVLSADPWIVFPGNLQGRHIRETGPKGVTLLTIESGKVMKVEEKALDLVRWELTSVDLTAIESLDDALDLTISEMDRLRDAAQGRVLATRVQLIGSTSLHAKLIADARHLEHQLVAHAVEEGDIYVERVQLTTTGTLSAEQLAGRKDALGDLFSTIEEIRHDPERRKQFWEDLLRPLSGIAADLMRDELVDPEEVLRDASRLLEAKLLSEHKESEL